MTQGLYQPHQRACGPDTRSMLNSLCERHNSLGLVFLSSPLLTLPGSSEKMVRTYYSEQCALRAACSAAQQDKGHMICFVIKGNNFQMSQRWQCREKAELSKFYLSAASSVKKKEDFSTPSTAFTVLFDDGHSDQYEVIPHCSFDLHFSDN